MNNIFGITLSDLEEYFLNIGEKKYRAVQVYDWLYKNMFIILMNFPILNKVLLIS